MNIETGMIGNDYEQMQRDNIARLKAMGYCEEVAKEKTASVIKPISTDFLSEKVKKQLAVTGKAYISRNSPCPCGSGKRFKRCCMSM